MTKHPAPQSIAAEGAPIYCFPLSTSEADKQHDIEQVNILIEHIKSQKRRTNVKKHNHQVGN